MKDFKIIFSLLFTINRNMNLNIRRIVRLSFIINFILLSSIARADSLIIFSDAKKLLDIGSAVAILEDKNHALSSKQALVAKDYKVSTQQVPNLGVSRSWYWVKFQIKNTSNSESLLLQLSYPIMDEVNFYELSPDSSLLTKIENWGDNYLFTKRKYKHQNFIFDLHIPVNESRIYLLKVASDEQLLIPLQIGIEKSIFESNLVKDLIFGIYFGIMLAMLGYNIFIYFTVRDRSYLYYVAYIIFVALTQAILHGYPFAYLWANSPWFANFSIGLFPPLAGIATVSFMRSFLHTKSFIPFLNKGLTLIAILYVAVILASLLGNRNLSYNLLDFNAAFISLYALLVGIVIARKGYRPAKFFLLAWLMFLIGVIIFVLRNVGILPYNYFTNYVMPAGVGAEVILLSFALADRINNYKKEKEQSQAEALRVSKENEELIKEQNIVLETKVAERTEALEHVLTNLKDTQTQLVQAEKMSSLGQLTAGIAHEINNPINFVKSNIAPLKLDIEDVFSILDEYGKLHIIGSDEMQTYLHKITQLKKQIDIDLVRNEVHHLLQGIEEGADRTSEIVRGLRNFSRLDEAEIKKVNIHEGLDSTLLLLRNRISENIQIVKAYNADGMIECFPSKLNQVFMNILSNGLDAIRDKPIVNKQEYIWITTENKNESEIQISLKDSGSGMSEEVKKKIFDPFYTTKTVGEGTGLGLAIVFKIIQQHRGKIDVNTDVGKGAEFVITLPKTYAE